MRDMIRRYLVCSRLQVGEMDRGMGGWGTYEAHVSKSPPSREVGDESADRSLVLAEYQAQRNHP